MEYILEKKEIDFSFYLFPKSLFLLRQLTSSSIWFYSNCILEGAGMRGEAGKAISLLLAECRKFAFSHDHPSCFLSCLLCFSSVKSIIKVSS